MVNSSMALKARILVVEDDPEILRILLILLRMEGFEAYGRPDGRQGLLAARQDKPDIVILDRMLPELDGLQVCERIRQTSDVPILMLSALGDAPFRVEGLNCGANDYMAKPFDADELLARVRCLLRARSRAPKTRFHGNDLVLDLASREVWRGGELISLTPREFDLLAYLLRHINQVMTRGQILERVWGDEFEGGDNVLEVYIRYLRSKLEREGKPRLIHTVRGVGYVLKG